MKTWIVVSIAATAAFSFCSGLMADEPAGDIEPAAYVVDCTGTAKIQRALTQSQVPENDVTKKVLMPGDIIRVQGTNCVTLIFPDGRIQSVKGMWAAQRADAGADQAASQPFWQKVRGCFCSRTVQPGNGGSKGVISDSLPELYLISVEMTHGQAGRHTKQGAPVTGWVVWAGPRETQNQRLCLVFWRNGKKIARSIPLSGLVLPHILESPDLWFFKAAIPLEMTTLRDVSAISLEDKEEYRGYIPSDKLPWTSVSWEAVPSFSVEAVKSGDEDAGNLVAKGIVLESYGCSATALEAYLKAYRITNNTLTGTALKTFLGERGPSYLLSSRIASSK